MEASWGRCRLAALWCLGLLGGLARVGGTHYRYLWRGCYPCQLGQAGYPVSAGDQRPGGHQARGGIGGGLTQGACFVRTPLFPLLKVGAGMLGPGAQGAGGPSAPVRPHGCPFALTALGICT